MTKNDAADATPKARELAAESNVDLSKVQGSGKDDKVTAQDVQEAADAPESMYEVEINEDALGINTQSIRLSTPFASRIFSRNARIGGTRSHLVTESEYEALKQLKSPPTEAHPNGLSYVKGGKA